MNEINYACGRQDCWDAARCLHMDAARKYCWEKPHDDRKLEAELRAVLKRYGKTLDYLAR